jgi:hypothetical protein
MSPFPKRSNKITAGAPNKVKKRVGIPKRKYLSFKKVDLVLRFRERVEKWPERKKKVFMKKVWFTALKVMSTWEEAGLWWGEV